jgi:hypothetical protein
VGDVISSLLTDGIARSCGGIDVVREEKPEWEEGYLGVLNLRIDEDNHFLK